MKIKPLIVTLLVCIGGSPSDVSLKLFSLVNVYVCHLHLHANALKT